MHTHVSSKLDFNVESLLRSNEVMGVMVNHKRVPLLVTFDEFAIPKVELSEFWANEESCPYASADAFITASMAHSLIGNFYLKFNKPARPTKIFSNTKDAVDWLKTFL